MPKDGKLVANPNKTWKEVNDKLPDWPIVAYIPGEKHGTREVFEEKVLLLAARPPALQAPGPRPKAPTTRPRRRPLRRPA